MQIKKRTIPGGLYIGGEDLLAAVRMQDQSPCDPICASYDDDCVDVKDKKLCYVSWEDEGRCPYLTGELN